MIDHKLSVPDDDIDAFYEVVEDNINESFDTARQLSFKMKCPIIILLFTNHRKNLSKEWITPYWQPRTESKTMSLSDISKALSTKFLLSLGSAMETISPSF